MAKKNSIVHMCQVFFNHPSVDGHLGCFHVLTIINTAGMKIGVHVSFQVQFSSVAHSCPILQPHESQHARPPCPSPSPGIHSDSTSIESVMPSSNLILGHPLLLLPTIPPSIRVFSNESTLRMRWPKYWRFSFSIIPSKEIPGLISFRMD